MAHAVSCGAPIDAVLSHERMTGRVCRSTFDFAIGIKTSKASSQFVFYAASDSTKWIFQIIMHEAGRDALYLPH